MDLSCRLGAEVVLEHLDDLACRAVMAVALLLGARRVLHVLELGPLALRIALRPGSQHGIEGFAIEQVEKLLLRILRHRRSPSKPSRCPPNGARGAPFRGRIGQNHAISSMLTRGEARQRGTRS